MNNLIKINLLPYREEMNKRKQQQFKTLMYGAVLTGVAAVAATYLFIDNMINNQSERNTLLETSIAHLDTELSEIQKLKQEKDAFLIKKNKQATRIVKHQEKQFASRIYPSGNITTHRKGGRIQRESGFGKRTGGKLNGF